MEANVNHRQEHSPGETGEPLSRNFFGDAGTNTTTIEALLWQLPERHEPYTDRYFLNTSRILAASDLNPWVRAQVMIRQGPGEVRGIDEALAIIARYSRFAEHGGRIYGLSDGDRYESGETLLVLEGPIQDIVELETMYLGVLSAETSKANEQGKRIDRNEVEARMRAVVEAADGRPVMYMGARHWRFDEDWAISLAAFRGGAAACSTEVGAQTVGREAVGTIPHVLENIMSWRYGRENAVKEATVAFDRVIEPGVRRIALIDYANREIDDALATARALGGRLAAVRVDTCGENIAQGALLSSESIGARELKAQGFQLPETTSPDARFWYGNGVTVTGVFALRRALDAAGFQEVGIVLSSGFGDPEKVRVFRQAENVLGVRLADSFGVGGVFDSRHAKMDIVAVGENADSLQPIAKAGRGERPNPRLKERVLPGNTTSEAKLTS